jgi:uncharacterized membrane protein YbhN (UPF0104 family)
MRDLVRLKRHVLTAGIALATVAGFYLMVRETGAKAVEAAASPDWLLLAGGLGLCAAVQPLRAFAWASTLRARVGFRAIYAASAIGSFLDTVLPGRLGEASKVAVLRVATGPRWPGVARAGGSLVTAHLLEAFAFALVGAATAIVLPVPAWARTALLLACGAALLAVCVLVFADRRLARRLPARIVRFLDGAAAPPSVLARTAALLVATWIARWGSLFFVLRAFDVEVGPTGALLYMVVTGIANVAPVLPGNAGVYQASALAALALVGEGGAPAVAVSVAAPVVGMVATAAAALVALAFYGRRFAELPRAALARA